jgi:hypothetical protein
MGKGGKDSGTKAVEHPVQEEQRGGEHAADTSSSEWPPLISV